MCTLPSQHHQVVCPDLGSSPSQNGGAPEEPRSGHAYTDETKVYGQATAHRCTATPPSNRCMIIGNGVARKRRRFKFSISPLG